MRYQLAGRLCVEDPKPGELAMSRVKPTERLVEARTRCDCKRMG